MRFTHFMNKQPWVKGRVPEWFKNYDFKQKKFTFARIQYSDTRPRGGEGWATDLPESDLNLAAQLGSLT